MIFTIPKFVPTLLPPETGPVKPIIYLLQQVERDEKLRDAGYIPWYVAHSGTWDSGWGPKER